jgi:hypothetical protein
MMPQLHRVKRRVALLRTTSARRGVGALDYLVPSIEAPDAWLQQNGRDTWSDELAVIVAEHHRLS